MAIVDIPNEISGQINNIFKERVLCLLFYGSNAYNRSKAGESDYDFYLMLDTYNSKDLKNIKSLSKSVNEFIDITFQYLDDIEKIGWSHYQHGNHGVFYLLHFSQAKTLLGHNIFQRKLLNLDNSSLIHSLLFQIGEYFWRLDHIALIWLEDNKIFSYTKKYLLRIIFDILLIFGDICFAEINTMKDFEVAKFITHKCYFSNKTKELIQLIFCTNDQQSDLDLMELTKRSLFNDYIIICSSKR